MKKAQLFSQPIFYIFILIVAALFLTWGIKNIFDLKDRAEQVELATFIQDIKNKVNQYYNFDYGSNTEINLRVPNKIQYICFTNNEPNNIPENLNTYGDLNKIFTLQKHNTFLLPLTSFSTTAFTTPNLVTEEDPLCIQTGGLLKATIENIGTSVQISKTI